MKAIQYMAISAVIISLSSCEKELDFKYHDIASLHVIEATLTETEATVTITESSPMDSPINRSHITDANVLLHDVTTGVEIQLNADSEGNFRSHTGGEIGHEYELEVKIGDKTYRSSTRMQAPVSITDANFYWVKMPGDDMAVLQIHFTDRINTEDYYWVRVYRNDKAYCWSVINDHSGTDGIIEETITTTHRDASQEDEKQLIKDGDKIKVTITPISREMMDYLTALSNNSNGMPQFTGDECLGYFLASTPSVSTLIFNSQTIEYAE